MAQFPYTLQSGFETGATGFDTAITDTESKSLGYLHYTQSVGKYGVVPWRGAYCWGIDQSVNTTTDVYQTEAGFNVADNSYWAISGAFYLKDITMAADARVSLVKIISAGPVEEGVVQLYYTAAGGLQVLVTQANDTAVGSNPVCPVTQNEWHYFEFYGQCDTAGAGDFYFVLDGKAIGSAGTLTNGAFTDFYLGSIDAGAGEFTVGYVFFDDIYAHLDTAAVRFGYRSRYPMNPHVSAIASAAYKEHLFLGPGTVKRATLLTGVAGDILRLYDTDTANTTGAYNMMAEMQCLDVDAAPIAVEGPVVFRRGCCVLLTPAGAAGARAIVEIDDNPPSGLPKPIYYRSDAMVKRYVSQRSVAPQDTT